MKKKKWPYVLIAIGATQIFVVVCLLITFLSFYKKDEQEQEFEIDGIYERFAAIERSNDVFCIAKYNYLSFDNQIIHRDYYAFEDDGNFISNNYPSLVSMFFGDYVFITDKSYYFTYEINLKESKSYLVFKKDWSSEEDAEYVMGVDYLPHSSVAISYAYSSDDGFYFYVYDESKWNMYYCNLESSQFSFIKSLSQKKSYDERYIKTEQISTIDDLNFSNNGVNHVVSFKYSCQEAYEKTIGEGFKPYMLYSFNNFSLCVFEKTIGSIFQRSIFSVFSYDWNENIEKYQGLFFRNGQDEYRFGSIFHSNKP